METSHRAMGWRPVEMGLVIGPVTFPVGEQLSLPSRRMKRGWSDGLGTQDIVAVMTLDSLWLDGRIDEKSGEPGVFLLPWEEAFRSTPTDRRLLGIQESEQVMLAIEPDENILSGRPPRVDVRSQESGTPLQEGTIRIGAALVAADGAWRWVSGDAGRALALLDAFPERPLDDQAATMLWFGRLQELARSAGAELRGQLADEEYVPVDQVEVDLEPISPEEVMLRPAPVGVPRDVLERQMKRISRGKVAPTWRRRTRGKVTRYCLSATARQAIETISRKGRLRGSEIPRAMEAPEALLEAPDEVLDGPAPALDLSRFGDRVIGVSLAPEAVRPVVNPVMHRFKSGESWGPGDLVGLEVGEEEEEDAQTAVPRDELRRLLRKAQEEEEPFQLFQGRWLDFRDAMARPEFMKQALEEEPDTSVRSATFAGAKDVQREDVPSGELVVHENVEAVTYEDKQEAGLGGLALLAPPVLLQATLYDYQHQGYSWLAAVTDDRLGGLLADDMGLGKTIQVITLLARLKEQEVLQPCLCVLPASLIPNWQDELAKFCPAITGVYAHQGPGRLKNPEPIQRFDVVLTTYECMRRDQLILGQVEWSVVVLDEAQRIKNAPTGVTRAAKGLNGRGRIALTGTPVENSLTDLWCILDYCQPGLLGSQSSFTRRYAKHIETAPESAEGQRLVQELKQKIAPAFLRRTKRDVEAGRNLPPKMEQRTESPMSPEQERSYLKILQKARDKKHGMFSAVNKLVRVCSHDWEVAGVPVPLEPENALRRCPKLETTMELVRGIADVGEKVLLFSPYKNTQRILQSVLALTFRDMLDGTVPILNGDLAAPRRQAEVKQFNQRLGFAALVLSTDATGVGLNITGANHVIHYTRVWNPAKERQATDRAHRIGQKRQVTVYYPIAVSERFETAEKKLDRILARKSRLADEVVVPTRIEKLIQEELTREITT